jgi:DNA polymerase-3 subunit delta'
MTLTTDIPKSLMDATEHQPSARAALAAALTTGPGHAYLFTGPPGSGKARAARVFAAEILADGVADPDGARRRALSDPSPHPDLVWLTPAGTQHLVAEIRERVIAAAAYRPFEGEHRVFVIDSADAMADEAQNALLKTLEEPAPFVHLVLLSSEPEALLETVRSRCQAVRFASLPAEAVVAALAERGEGRSDEERLAAARLAYGDAGRAALLVTETGRELRDAAEACVRSARSGELATGSWTALLTAAEAEGERAGAEARARLSELAAERGEGEPRRSKEAEDAVRRAARRARTDGLDLGLALLAAWLRDLAAVAEGAPELSLNADRAEELRAEADGVDPRRARRAAELVMDTRRRLSVNVSEELALEALVFRLEAVLTA